MDKQMKKNQFCSKKIETSQFVFIRNVQEHTALEAAQHLRKKIENTKNLFWFGAKRQISYDDPEEWFYWLPQSTIVA